MSKENDRFKAMVEDSQDWFWEFDENANFTYSSQRIRNFLGYEPEEIIGLNAFDLMGEEEAKRVHRHFDPIAKKYLPFNNLINVNQHKDGHKVVIESSGTPIFDQAGHFRGYRGIDRDITDRMLTEDLLEKSTSKLKDIIETSTEWIWEIDIAGHHTYSNDALMSILDYSSEEFIGKPLSDLLHEDDLAEVISILPEHIKEKRGWQGWILRWQHKDGSYRYLESNAKPVMDSAGQVVGFRGADRDVTERKYYERELEKARDAAESNNRAKDEFLANMSHELRTPMAGIIGMLEVSLDGELSEPQRGYLQVVEKSANTLMRILNDILEFSKIEAGVLTLIEAPFHLHETVRGAVALFELEAQRKELDLVLDIAPDTPQIVEGDEGRLRQILVNLVGNAIKFTEWGQVAIRVKVGEITAEGRRDTILTVTDTGIGIPEDKQKNLFQPFIQADASDSRRYGGTGLGLSISQTLAERMGGTICFNSKSGHGSTFVVTLPFQETTAIPAVPTSAEALNSRPALANTYKAHLLVAEDDSALRTLIGIKLQQKGISFDFACNGAEAVEMWPRAVYDLILMDIQMPLMNGYQATRAIRDLEEDRGGHVPIVALTAHAYQVDQQKCLQAGMDAYLAKPIKFDNLFLLIGNLLDMKEVKKIN